MNLNDTQKQLFEDIFFATFNNRYLDEHFAGFRNILNRLVEYGTSISSANYSITNHFTNFPYFKVTPSEEAIGSVFIAFDREAFLKSDRFQDDVQRMILQEQKTMAEHYRKIQDLHTFIIE